MQAPPQEWIEIRILRYKYNRHRYNLAINSITVQIHLVLWIRESKLK